MLTLDRTPRPWQSVTADLMGYKPGTVSKRKGKNRYRVLDTIAAYDTETTSITVDIGAKIKPVKHEATIDSTGVHRRIEREATPQRMAAGAIVYAWAVAIQGRVYVGRTWAEFDAFRRLVNQSLNVSINRRLIVWVHNLSFEFQFLRRRQEIVQVFATGEREVVTAVTADGWEYHCSFKLTLASLKYVASDILRKHVIAKMTGDLDYSKPRGPWTPLTDEEWGYIVNDVLILNALIDERAEEDGGLTKIPLTKTSYVRNECREACFKVKGYQKWIKDLTLSPDQYQQLKLCAGGGFTHSSVWHTGVTIADVTSYDIASSYPTVMVCEMFPMSNFDSDPGVRDEADLEAYKGYLWYARLTFEGIQHTEESDVTLSRSKCYDWGRPVKEANGRILAADKVTTWVTNLDYEILKDFYRWDTCSIDYFNWSAPGYLPKVLVEQILTYYEGKTSLKGVNDIAYARSKERVNSVFGMMLTDPIRDVIEYTNGDPSNAVWQGWRKQPPNLEEQLEKYNNDRNRFNWYAWGVWVTAYARRNVTRAIKAIGKDYIYCDTDSVKIMHAEKYKAWFAAYCDDVDAKIRKALEYHGIDPKRGAPMDKKGNAHPLGHFEFDGHYDRFKTLGAKRYLYEDAGELHSTVAGCGKKGLARYLSERTDPFESFCDDLRVPSDYTEKLTHTYGDNRIEGELTDYLGVTGKYEELSWVHLGPCEYHMGVADEFLWWINQYGQTVTQIQGPGGEC